MKACTRKSVVVAGDLTLDWNVAAEHSGAAGHTDGRVAARCQPGGIALLGELLAEACALEGFDIDLARVVVPAESLRPENPTSITRTRCGCLSGRRAARVGG